MSTEKEIWDEIKERIKNTSNIQGVQYRTWIEPLEDVEFGNSVLYITAPHSISKKSILDRYRDIIETAVFKVTKRNYRIYVMVPGEVKPKEVDIMDCSPEVSIIKQDVNHLNPRYTFDNFVVGSSNRLAHAYALSVAESPGKRNYNPLFFYGKPGLGKTHLCQAIGHFVRQDDTEKKVIYISAEKYTNEFISSIQTQTTDMFKEKYRNVDILIVDDVQFFAGKESTLEEFFHTFNDLYDNGKQLVLTADRPPKEINNIDERMISRFAWGLVCEITPPDFETRIAILKNKAESEGVEFSDDVYVYIAENIKSNIRELEGALNKILAYSEINKDSQSDLTLIDLLKENISEDSNIDVSFDMVKEACCKYFHVTMEEFMGKGRRKEIVFARQIGMYLATRCVKKSNSSIIGREFERDHSTVLYAINKISNDVKNKNEKIISIVDDIETILRS